MLHESVSFISYCITLSGKVGATLHRTTYYFTFAMTFAGHTAPIITLHRYGYVCKRKVTRTRVQTVRSGVILQIYGWWGTRDGAPKSLEIGNKSGVLEFNERCVP